MITELFNEPATARHPSFQLKDVNGATLRTTLRMAEGKSVGALSFAKAITATVRMLQATEQSITGKRARVTWYIGSLGMEGDKPEEEQE